MKYKIVPNLKILIVFKNPKTDCATACHQGLGVTSSYLTQALREFGINSDCFPIANGEYLWNKLLKEWSVYTHIIMCAPFIDAPFLGRLFKNFPKHKFVLVYHSNLGFLCHDRFAVSSLKPYFTLEDSLNNFNVATNCEILSNSIETGMLHKFTYLPNMLPITHKLDRTRPIWNHNGPLNIGLFGAARVLKNWLTAGVGAMIIANKLNTPIILHVNSSRDEGAAATRENLYTLLSMNNKITLKEVTWLDHDDFVRYLYSIDLLLQPSFSETFNNVTAEGCYAGIPSVVTNAITWVPDYWKAIADNALSVAEIGINLLNNTSSGIDGYNSLKVYVYKAIKVWLEYLGVKNEPSIYQRISEFWGL